MRVFQRIAPAGVGQPAARRYRGRVPSPIAACAGLACCLLAVSAVAAPAAVAGGPDLASSALWATVDVCDTSAHPDTIGIRGSMPGDGEHGERMFMAFSVEYRHGGVWQRIGAAGESGFRLVGGAAARSRQAGIDFTLAASTSRSYALRGVVTFLWRRGATTVASTVRSTTAGHGVTAGADPQGYSRSTCSIPEKRRGSLVITPVTPSLASASMRAASLTVQT
jgi:hypothetical protein